MDSMSTLSAGVEVDRERPAAGIGEEEFDALVVNYQRRIYRVLWAVLRDHDGAETLTQECFLRAYKKRHSYRAEAGVYTWLVRIALNLAADYRRNRRAGFWRRLFAHAEPGIAVAAGDTPGEEIEGVADGRTGAEQALSASEEVSGMWRAVGALPPRQRSVFVLRFVEEMKLQEIGQTLGLSVASVKTHLHRATMAVRQHLQSKEGCRS